VDEDHWLLGWEIIGWVNSFFEGFEASNDRSGCGGFEVPVKHDTSQGALLVRQIISTFVLPATTM
jgi:hypothetical protein